VHISGSYNGVAGVRYWVKIEWGDGRRSWARVNRQTGTFTASHRYRDDYPTGTSADDFTITATVIGRDGTHNLRILTVTNDAPHIIGSPLDNVWTNRYARTYVAGWFSDAGWRDTHTISIDWGDGDTSSWNLWRGSRRIWKSHIYDAPGTYTVTLTVIDDDGGQDTQIVDIAVDHSRPDWCNGDWWSRSRSCRCWGNPSGHHCWSNHWRNQYRYSW